MTTPPSEPKVEYSPKTRVVTVTCILLLFAGFAAIVFAVLRYLQENVGDAGWFTLIATIAFVLALIVAFVVQKSRIADEKEFRQSPDIGGD